MKRNSNIKNRWNGVSPAFSLSTCFDNGEILQQKKSDMNYEEYVVQSSITDIPFEEYIIAREDEPLQNFNWISSTAPQKEARTVEPPDKKKEEVKTDEEKLKLLDGINPNTAATSAKPAYEQKEEPVSKQSAFEYLEPDYKDQKGSTDDDAEDTFAKDMEAILKGKKKYNEKTKTLEEREHPSPTAQQQSAEKTPSLEQFTNQHAIFDQIAKSMEYAKAYDLGSISMSEKFDDFDKTVDLENARAEEKKITPVSYAKSTETVSTSFRNEEILKDIDAISKLAKIQEALKVKEAVIVEKPVIVERPLYESDTARIKVKEQNKYVYESQSQVVTQALSHLSYMQNPAVIGGIAVGDAIQIGLGAAAVVQAQVSATQGSFTLSYDKAQRMLTNEARSSMPGSQKTKQSYTRQLFWIGELKEGFADATVIIEWEGNPYGEIGTAIIRRDLKKSTEWTKSSNNTTITKVDRIPLPGTDPRVWPLVFTYEGTFDPAGNGHYEYSGEFEINAFGGLRFIRHEVADRSLIEWAKMGEPEEYVKRGQDIVVPVPEIPKEQVDYLRSKLP